MFNTYTFRFFIIVEKGYVKRKKKLKEVKHTGYQAGSVLLHVCFPLCNSVFYVY